MKHRWLACLLLSAALALAACTPAEGGEDARESAPAPADVYDGY
jgi:predicted small secreted protein